MSPSAAKALARIDGKAVFVPFTIDGERVTARIMREKKQFAEAELERGDRAIAATRLAPSVPTSDGAADAVTSTSITSISSR